MNQGIYMHTFTHKIDFISTKEYKIQMNWAQKGTQLLCIVCFVNIVSLFSTPEHLTLHFWTVKSGQFCENILSGLSNFNVTNTVTDSYLQISQSFYKKKHLNISDSQLMTARDSWAQHNGV